jgi:biotin carboxyl carrier protein
MYTVTVNAGRSLRTDLSIEGNRFKGMLDDKEVSGDIIRISEWQYHMVIGNKSYNVEVVKLNAEEKTMALKLNGMRYVLQLKDKYDELLHSLGLDKLAGNKVNEIKAPMPGMVLNVLVKEGDVVKKGDALIVLEAMKMENILKSPAEGTVKRVVAQKGTAVEKNQLLIQF